MSQVRLNFLTSQINRQIQPESVIFIEKSDHRRGKHEGIRHPNYYKNLGGKKFEGKRNYICGKCNAGFSNKGSMLHHVCGSKKGTQ